MTMGSIMTVSIVLCRLVHNGYGIPQSIQMQLSFKYQYNILTDFRIFINNIWNAQNV